MKEKKRLAACGITIKKRMLELGLSNMELANMLNCNESYVCRILYGERSGRKYMTRISEILGIDYDCLMNDKTDKDE